MLKELPLIPPTIIIGLSSAILTANFSSVSRDDFQPRTSSMSALVRPRFCAWVWRLLMFSSKSVSISFLFSPCGSDILTRCPVWLISSPPLFSPCRSSNLTLLAGLWLSSPGLFVAPCLRSVLDPAPPVASASAVGGDLSLDGHSAECTSS